jgi:hypothetical protein
VDVGNSRRRGLSRPARSMSSRTGIWNLAPGIPVTTTNTGTANAEQVLRSCSTSDCCAHTCIRNKSGRSPPDRWDESLRRRKLPACLHRQTRHNRKETRTRAYPAQMLKLRRTHEFPETVYIGLCTPIGGMPRTASAQSDLPPPGPRGRLGRRAARSSKPSQAGIGQPETADDPVRVAEDPGRRRWPPTEGTGASP